MSYTMPDIKALSLARKVAKFELTTDNWQEKVRDWAKVSFDNVPGLKFNEMFEYCDEQFGDDWCWSKDVMWRPLFSFYFLHEEHATIFKLKYENYR